MRSEFRIEFGDFRNNQMFSQLVAEYGLRRDVHNNTPHSPHPHTHFLSKDWRCQLIISFITCFHMNDHHDNILIVKNILMIITGHLGPRPNPAIFRSTGSQRPALLGEEKSTATMRMIRMCITIGVVCFAHDEVFKKHCFILKEKI